MTKVKVTHTPFTKGLMNSKQISNRVKQNIEKFLNTVQHAEITDLFKIMSDITSKLSELEIDLKSEEVRLNGILLVIVEDELTKRNTSIEPKTN